MNQILKTFYQPRKWKLKNLFLQKSNASLLLVLWKTIILKYSLLEIIFK